MKLELKIGGILSNINTIKEEDLLLSIFPSEKEKYSFWLNRISKETEI